MTDTAEETDMEIMRKEEEEEDVVVEPQPLPHDQLLGQETFSATVALGDDGSSSSIPTSAIEHDATSTEGPQSVSFRALDTTTSDTTTSAPTLNTAATTDTATPSRNGCGGTTPAGTGGAVAVSDADASSNVNVGSCADGTAPPPAVATTNPPNNNQAVASSKYGLSKKTPRNRSRAAQAGDVPVSVASPSSGNATATIPSAQATAAAAEEQLTALTTTDAIATTTRVQNNTTSTPTAAPNGLSKKTPRARARAAQGFAAVTVSGITGAISGIIPPLRGLGKNQPPTTQPPPQQQQQHTPSRTKCGLRQNRQNRLGSQNQNQNEGPSPTGSEGTNNDGMEQQATDAVDEDPSFLPSSLDASPSLQGEPAGEITSFSLGQQPNERAAPNLAPPPPHSREVTLGLQLQEQLKMTLLQC